MILQRLVPHPDTPSPAVRELTVAVEPARASVRLAYTLRGDLDALAIPAATTPRPADELWRHTCFEAFAAPGEGEPYYEFNFAPSGQWAVYGFAAYRQRRDGATLAPSTAWERDADRLLLNAVLPMAPPLRLGLSAVIETRAGAHAYWALRHPGPRPDFHHAGSFALHLPAGEDPRC
ncbi:DOMON-like domain-containing protein [bacterium]|nr:DOMON-like domain-containing protein [bacterium]